MIQFLSKSGIFGRKNARDSAMIEGYLWTGPDQLVRDQSVSVRESRRITVNHGDDKNVVMKKNFRNGLFRILIDQNDSDWNTDLTFMFEQS